MKPISVVDIAREAGVSTATVSRVLNGSERVASDTRSHVLAVIERLGFAPNASASSLRRGHSNAIGVAVASISQPWHVKLVRELRQAVSNRGMTTVIYDLEHSNNVLIEHTESARRLRLAGMVLATGDRLDSPQVADSLRRLADSMPLVVIGQHLEDASWPTIYFDDIGASEMAACELLKRRSRPLLFLGSSPRSYLSLQRLEGVKRALSGVPDLLCDSVLVEFEGVMDYAAGYEAVFHHRNQIRNFGLIFCVNDEIALGALRAVSELGLRVPEDLMIIGYGDVDMLPYLRPSLSSLSGDVSAIASDALEAVMGSIYGDPTFSTRVHTRRIVHRESTAV
ncbi:LacI family DNA-binding transcriptional regulator [Brevibacterium luteolum]|uniref:LacI family DNA-binding transcriptional regulator n=1 Tax=Brevibacterium luteolum TaxID=199591 RepID=UPI00223C0E8B|nr:LacI family DNA-binding transcriptional regulator [Brevibacterium luteolum]MCT1657725.1 LacI family transcriptional regulator [Brevibacterium luteolum]